MSDQDSVIEWFIENQRDLPWRKSTPWGVFVSEFMLQQTPVNRVLPKWHEWMERWPSPTHLAAAASSDVIKAWDRLGYPRRALRLHESAQVISQHHGGEVPTNYEALLALPGVGDYTAGAILSFAFGQRAVVLDTNVRRVINRWHVGAEFPTTSLSKAERALAEELIPERSALWAGATMELGALICTSKKPACEECPLRATCAWRCAGYPAGTPMRTKGKWHGSDRQCRGTIMAAIREGETHIAAISWPDAEQLQRCIVDLEREKLLTQKDKQLSLPTN